jgi:hypothetical protein
MSISFGELGLSTSSKLSALEARLIAVSVQARPNKGLDKRQVVEILADTTAERIIWAGAG